MCSWLHSCGWRILADVSDQTAPQFGCGDILQLARGLNLWGLRLDDGFSLEEACRLAAQIPVAVNASTTAPAQAAALAAAGPEVIAMHNFYPRPETGLGPGFPAGEHPDAAGSGDEGLGLHPGRPAAAGARYEGLPTLEAHRKVPPLAAFADLAVNYRLDGIFVGDPGVSSCEQEQISSFCTTGVLPVPVQLAAEQEGLYGKVFTCRPDSPAGWCATRNPGPTPARAGRWNLPAAPPAPGLHHHG